MEGSEFPIERVKNKLKQTIWKQYDPGLHDVVGLHCRLYDAYSVERFSEKNLQFLSEIRSSSVLKTSRNSWRNHQDEALKAQRPNGAQRKPKGDPKSRITTMNQHNDYGQTICWIQFERQCNGFFHLLKILFSKVSNHQQIFGRCKK